MFFLFCRLLLGYICNNFRKIPLARFPPGYFPTIFLYIPFSRRFPCTQPRIWVYAKIFFKNTHVILLLEAQPSLLLDFTKRAHVSAVRCFHSVFALCARQSWTAIAWSSHPLYSLTRRFCSHFVRQNNCVSKLKLRFCLFSLRVHMFQLYFRCPNPVRILPDY